MDSPGFGVSRYLDALRGPEIGRWAPRITGSNPILASLREPTRLYHTDFGIPSFPFHGYVSHAIYI